MESAKAEQFKEKIKAAWDKVFNKPDEEGAPEVGREKIIVFAVAFVLALFMWLMVNLSRDYNLNVNLPIELGNMPSDKALAKKLPDHASVSVAGEGWKLINVYNNPPVVFVDVTKSEINLYDQVQQQLRATSDIAVQKVQPLLLTLDIEDKVSKKVPVVSNVKLNFRNQFGLIGNPTLTPDSVTISGAASMIEPVESWETDSLEVNDVTRDISTQVKLKRSGSLFSFSRDQVSFKADVAQYTEGEARVVIESRNFPAGRSVSFSPSSISVKYQVPIDEYAQVQDLENPLVAYVTYAQLQQDSTGFVSPQIESTANAKDIHLKTQAFQPSEIAYFIVVE